MTRKIHKTRKNKRRSPVIYFLMLAVIIAVEIIIVRNYLDGSYESILTGLPNRAGYSQNRSALKDEEWSLILVNANNSVPEDHEISLTELSNGQFVDSRIYPDLQKMFDDMREQGIYPVVGEGYRTHEAQQKMMDDKIQAYINSGFNKKSAKALAEAEVAMPGTSEHELGIAVDINADKERSTNDEVYDWLAENAYKYGFIQRYPFGKYSITGIDYEPWHYRYVGIPHSEKIYSGGVCLEEYLENYEEKEN